MPRGHYPFIPQNPGIDDAAFRQVVLASSKASAMRQPLLELALYVANADGSTSEQVLEMDRAEVDRLIASLSNVRDAMNRIPY